MKSIFKNFLFVLKRFKTSSILNILGLSIALAVFIISFLQAEYDFSFDKGFKKHKDIYMLYSKMSGTNVDLPVTTPYIVNKMPKDFAEVKSSCMTTYTAGMPVESFSLPNDAKVHNAYYFEASAGFIDVFTPEIIAGKAEKVFEEPGYAMIPESMAKKAFEDANPIGKALVRKGSDAQLIIAAVYKDFPERSTLVNGVCSRVPDSEDSPNSFNLSYYGFFEIEKQNVEALAKKINDKWLDGFIGSWLQDMEFVPLTEVHYKSNGGSRNTTISLLAIGIIILIISYINYINFSIALAPARVRGLNIRKILGEKNSKMRMTLSSEVALFSLFSFIISLFFVYLTGKSFVNEFLSVSLLLENHVKILIILAIAVCGLGFLIGLHPAIYTTRFRPATVLNGKFALSGKGTGLRNTLVTLQFFASVVLIIVSLMIKMQHDFMHSESWKFERDNIVYIETPFPEDRAQYEAFISELESNPHVSGHTYSAFLPGTVGSFTGTSYKGKTITMASWSVAPGFLDFFGIPIKEGADFSNDTSGQIIINQKAIDVFEFENIIGDSLFDNSVVYGVIDNINFHSLERQIEPMAFIKGKPEDIMYFLLIKISGQNTAEALNSIEKSWKKLHAGDFNIHFLDETFDTLYEQQDNLAKLITLFGFIALFIALMGVYGMVIFNAKYKEKEIAIRKVNGSSVKEIIFMLNRNVLVQLSIASIIAIPTAYFIVNKWLESFAYKIPIYWWVFLLGGLIVFLITIATVSFQSYKAAIVNPVKSLNKE